MQDDVLCTFPHLARQRRASAKGFDNARTCFTDCVLRVPPPLQDDLRGRSLTDSGERPYVLSKSYLLMGNTRELARRCEGSGVDVIAGQDQGQHQLQCVDTGVP
jgi:hypothetical protein